MNMSVLQCTQVADLLKTVAHPIRLMILCHLSDSAKTVGQLEKLCETSQSQISQFLIRMKREQLLNSEKHGRFVFYSIKDKRIEKLMQSMHTIFHHPVAKKREQKHKHKELS
jgi:ArsR family transcriptional regulator, virulence genes transcriptional regulator